MDIISHGLWARIIFRRKKIPWWTVAFAILPDLVAFGPYLALQVLRGGIVSVFAVPEIYPKWVIIVYNLSHSLVIAGLIFYALLFLHQELAILFLAWPLHIIIDIPTHSADCFPTKFLYPLSHLYFAGIHWRTWFILIGNWGALALTLLIINRYRSDRGEN
jgi:hypothetical protein